MRFLIPSRYRCTLLFSPSPAIILFRMLEAVSAQVGISLRCISPVSHSTLYNTFLRLMARTWAAGVQDEDVNPIIAFLARHWHDQEGITASTLSPHHTVALLRALAMLAPTHVRAAGNSPGRNGQFRVVHHRGCFYLHLPVLLAQPQIRLFHNT